MTGDPVCGGGNKICSYKKFAVSEGQVFNIVADVFDGVGGNAGYDFNKSWKVEVVCTDTESLLLNEDFTDAVCSGCSETVEAGPDCVNFGWHSLGGFADIVTGYYLGQLDGSTLLGYDCGSTKATLSFPKVTLPGSASKCSLTFDYFAGLDPADDGDCINDKLTVGLSVGAGPKTTLAASSCATKGSSSNPIGHGTEGVSQAMTYDLTSKLGSAVTVYLDWFADGASNGGVGVIIDNVTISCTGP